MRAALGLLVALALAGCTPALSIEAAPAAPVAEPALDAEPGRGATERCDGGDDGIGGTGCRID